MKTFFESIQNRLRLRFIATTPQEQAQGLMHQPPLVDEAALFIYKKPTKGKFWNKNVSFPIDIGFFDSGKKLVDIGHLEAEQKKGIISSKEFTYALETPSGFFKSKDIGRSLEDFVYEF